VNRPLNALSLVICLDGHRHAERIKDVIQHQCAFVHVHVPFHEYGDFSDSIVDTSYGAAFCSKSLCEHEHQQDCVAGAHTECFGGYHRSTTVNNSCSPYNHVRCDQCGNRCNIHRAEHCAK